MKRIYKIGKHREFLLKKAISYKVRKKTLPKGKNTESLRAHKNLHEKYREQLKDWDRERKKFYITHYALKKFDDKEKIITVNNPIGSEVDIEYLANVGQQLTESYPKKFIIDIKNCERVWPSGVMLLCSFYHWTRLIRHQGSNTPEIVSTDSRYDDVSSYLNFCGFHDYVNRKPSKTLTQFDEKDIVKIKVEQNTLDSDKRYVEICNLVEDKSSFDTDQLEEFKSTIFGEILGNVTEHGINFQRKGWYLLTQVHKNTKIISFNIADNGIGIKNSLQTGPQKIKLERDLDHEYIKESLNDEISGAFSAVKKKERRHKRGSGMSRIKESCKKLKCCLTIISNRGYIQFDTDGIIKNEKTFNEVIFSGTLYNLTIPLKKEIQNGSY